MALLWYRVPIHWASVSALHWCQTCETFAQ